MNRIEEINARKQEIRSMLEGTVEVDMDAVEKELRELNEEQEKLEKRAAVAASIQTGEVIAPVVEKPQEERKMENKFDSVEYREAFMAYVCRGQEMPVEFRDNTNTSDIGALVPPVTLNKIIETIESYGTILPLVNRTSYKTGMTIPMASIKPTASWVAEGAGSTKQKLPLDASITFGHFKLRCTVSVSLETETMALSAFEARLVKSISEAMAKAIEQAILTGTGSGQPTGILTDASKGTTLNYDALTYKKLVDAEAAIPVEYEQNAVWVMSKKTFMEFIGMVDDRKQPIARIDHGINGAPERTLLGRRVVITNYLPNFAATLTTDDVFAMVYDFGDYTLNTNFQVGIKTYEDNETDDIVRKSIMVVDGKPIQYNSLVKLAGTATPGNNG